MFSRDTKHTRSRTTISKDRMLSQEKGLNLCPDAAVINIASNSTTLSFNVFIFYIKELDYIISVKIPFTANKL